MKRAYPDDDHAQYVEMKTKSQIYIPDHRLIANTYIHDSVKLYLILLSTFISIILYSKNYRYDAFYEHNNLTLRLFTLCICRVPLTFA